VVYEASINCARRSGIMEEAQNTDEPIEKSRLESLKIKNEDFKVGLKSLKDRNEAKTHSGLDGEFSTKRPIRFVSEEEDFYPKENTQKGLVPQ
jgi:hypothetical protein